MDIHTVPADQKVSEPGVYDLPIERYHSQCCIAPSISSSGLRSILSESPAHFWLKSDMNPNRIEEGEKEAFVLGRAAHHLLLGEAEFGKHFAVRPEKWDSWRTNDCKAWRAQKQVEGITVLDPKQIEQIRGMAGLLPYQKGMLNCGLANTPLVKSGILAGEIECSILFEQDGIWLKSRPDAIPSASGDVADLKTTAGISDRDLSRTVYERGYHVQGALVGMALKYVLDIDMQSFTLVFVDKAPPYPVAVKTLTDADIALGERQIFAAVSVFKRCLSAGVWPGPTARQADAQYLNMPSWGRDEIERQLDVIEQEIAA